MVLLAIESSCDETSVAVVVDGCLRANQVASQIDLHSEYGGVVPELATREHLKNLLPVARAAMRESGVTSGDLTAVAATRGPGLPAALQAGYSMAQSLAYALNVPFLGVHHHEAHLYSPWIEGSPPQLRTDRFEPNVSLIVSGGHTLLVEVSEFLKHRVAGGTLDDAAGECFDKVAKMLGLPYPGGPRLDQLAELGCSNAHTFPRPMLKEVHDDFSFSGLKTSVRYYLNRHPEWRADASALNDLCASVRAAVVDTLVGKTVQITRRLGLRCVTASGGVTCNLGLRRDLASACARQGWTLRLADRGFCTDNAAMVGLLATAKLEAGARPTDWDTEVKPGWPLDLAEAERGG